MRLNLISCDKDQGGHRPSALAGFSLASWVEGDRQPGRREDNFPKARTLPYS